MQEPNKVRGTATIWPDNKIEFRPQGEGQPVKEPVSKTALSDLYKTSGEKQNHYVAHLKIPGDSLNPAADLLSQLHRLCKSLPKPPKELPAVGKVLKETPNVQIRSTAKGVISVKISINLAETPDYKAEMYNHFQTISTCLAINENSLSQLRRATLKRLESLRPATTFAPESTPSESSKPSTTPHPEPKPTN